MSSEANASQKELVRLLTKWSKTRNSPLFVYTGPPGSGKTWVIRLFFEQLGVKPDEYITCAYQGKAVSVLAMRGMPAKTIHSLIYCPVYTRDVDDKGEVHYKFEFVKRDHLDPKLKFIVVDELSMVNDAIMNDLLSFGIPVIGMGDINQLPPVFGESTYMLRPDFYLNEIMRQAKDSPIIQMSQMILHDQYLEYGSYGNCNVLRNMKLDSKIYTDYDMIICGRNSTRDFINNYMRHEIFHIKEKQPIIGDKIICKQNNWDRCVNGIYLTNGTVGFVSDISDEHLTDRHMMIDFVPEYDRSAMYYNIDLDTQFITRPYELRKDMGFTKYTKFEYAYAITAHSSQGSQYNRVLFIDEPFGGGKEMIKKLRYTAITRAVEKVDVVNGYNLINSYVK